MKKKFFYIAMVALALTGCADNLSGIDSSDGKTNEVVIPADAENGECRSKSSVFLPSVPDFPGPPSAAAFAWGKSLSEAPAVRFA